MATIQSAQAKYERKMASATTAWNNAKGRAKSNYASGLARFLGTSPSPLVVDNFSKGIDAAQYRGGDSKRWAERYMAAMTGR